MLGLIRHAGIPFGGVLRELSLFRHRGHARHLAIVSGPADLSNMGLIAWNYEIPNQPVNPKRQSREPPIAGGADSKPLPCPEGRREVAVCLRNHGQPQLAVLA
jgi:hypothetical protein